MIPLRRTLSPAFKSLTTSSVKGVFTRLGISTTSNLYCCFQVPCCMTLDINGHWHTCYVSWKGLYVDRQRCCSSTKALWPYTQVVYLHKQLFFKLSNLRIWIVFSNIPKEGLLCY